MRVYVWRVVSDADRKSGSAGSSLLMISSQNWEYSKYQCPFRTDLVKCSTKIEHVYQLVIKDSDHQNFCDSFFMVNPRLMIKQGMLGSADFKMVTRAINYVILNMFASDISVTKLVVTDNEVITSEETCLLPTVLQRTPFIGPAQTLMEFFGKNLHRTGANKCLETYIANEWVQEHTSDTHYFNGCLPEDSNV